MSSLVSCFLIASRFTPLFSRNESDTGCVYAGGCVRSCVRSAVSFLRKGTARGHTLQSWGRFPLRPLFSLRESVITHSFADLTTLPGEHADYGTLSFRVPHTTELHWHTVSLVPCSSRLLGQSAYASHVSLSDWLRGWPR